MDIKDGYGIGEKLSQKLKETGITTIEEFIEMNFYDYCKMMDLDVEEATVRRFRKFEYHQGKNWEIVNKKSEQIKKEVLLRIKNNKGIDKKEFNKEEERAILMLLGEGMIYEQEENKYAYVQILRALTNALIFFKMKQIKT